MFAAELPYPPSVNHYYRHVGFRTLISREGRAYRKRVCSILRSGGVTPMSGPLDVELDLHPPDNRRRDVDNILKSLLDSLQHGRLYHDDSQIVRLAAQRSFIVPGGKVAVRVRERTSA